MNAKLAALLLAFFPFALAAQEICNNGIDDDGDGLIDLNDPDCPCSTLIIPENTPSYIRNHSFEERGCCPLGFVGFFTPPWLDCALGWHQATAATSDYFHSCGYSPVGFNLPPADGQGAVGFFALPGYFEYVGTCLTYPAPSNPLLAGVTYTLSLWISAAVSVGAHQQTQAQADPSVFTDQLPLAIFGHANECVAFPIATMDCIGYQPGWAELGRVMVQPAWDWTRVSITFTPTQDIHSIMIGGACDTPASLDGKYIVGPDGQGFYGDPYYIVDDLMLTIAQDQLLSPTNTTGDLCAGDVVATAQPPGAATNYQWYRNGVALPGQTATTLNISAGNYGPGTYTMASNVNGECLMGSAYVPPPAMPNPLPSLSAHEGCAPLAISFADTTGGGTQTVQWNLGDGTTRSDSSFTHIYNQPGTYSVALQVRNGGGCMGDTLLHQVITVHPPAQGSIEATPQPADVADPHVLLQGNGTGGIVSWWWDLGAGDPANATTQDVHALFPAEPGEYPVMLVVSTAFGCIDTVRSVVVVVKPGVIEMPNVFSPNGDGRNDRFTPRETDGVRGTMEIYNRWGQLIFTTQNLGQGWSGKDAPDGTYFYIVTPEDPNAPKHSGHVTLVR